MGCRTSGLRCQIWHAATTMPICCRSCRNERTSGRTAIEAAPADHHGRKKILARPVERNPRSAASRDKRLAEPAEMQTQDLLRPMSEFDPLEPALLHDRLKDR